MEILGKTLSCPYCSKILQSPVILPCGETICSHHVLVDDHSSSPTTTFYCPSCHIEHARPTHGYPRVKTLEKILDMNLANLTFGSGYQQAVEANKRLGTQLESCRLLATDPDYEIDKAIGPLRNGIDLEREQFKVAIDARIDNKLNELNRYESDCRKRARSHVTRLEALIDTIEATHLESERQLNLLEINEIRWQRVSEVAEEGVQDLEEEKANFMDQTFLKKLKDFEFDNLRHTHQIDLINKLLEF